MSPAARSALPAPAKPARSGRHLSHALSPPSGTGLSYGPGSHDFPQGYSATRPNPENQKAYDDLYRLYRELHDAFGGVNRNADLSKVMKELIAIKNKQNK